MLYRREERIEMAVLMVRERLKYEVEALPEQMAAEVLGLER